MDVPNGPRKLEEDITAIPPGTGTGRFQRARPGSHGIVSQPLPFPDSSVGVGVSFFFQAWMPQCDHVQTLLSTVNESCNSGFAAVISADGTLAFWVGTGTAVEVVDTGFRPPHRGWVGVSATIRGTVLMASTWHVSLLSGVDKAVGKETFTHNLTGDVCLTNLGDLMVGASHAASAPDQATHFFNGRIDHPRVEALIADQAVPPAVLINLDFSRQISGDVIVDVSGHGLDGVLFNAPTRGVQGHDWDGTEPNWTKAAYGYDAIHFHEDDLDDAAWATDFEIVVPSTARSGAYAVVVSATNGTTSDSVPFFVRPSPGTQQEATRAAKVAVVLSTFTYLAYANEHLWDKTRSSAIDVGPGFDMADIAQSEDFARMQRRDDLGLSCYDVHRDGSGVVFSSARRPILNIRPGYIMWAFKRPREFSADTMLIGLLERAGIPYEVLTDHDLDAGGMDVLRGFNTVLTGSHPEYPSPAVYGAYLDYARQGGNLIYLGGNGFYWVVGADSQASPHRIEVRRGDQGVRTYTLPGGEHVLSTTGQQGALWRTRGLACNVLFGVGFAGEGVAPGVPYKRRTSDKPGTSDTDWIFAGLEEDELIGVHGLGGGASGDEVDRYDAELGSPADAIVLATSTGHSDAYGIVPEDLTFPIGGTVGTQTDRIRSDMVFLRTPAGGGVFSVGSINWCCSVGWNDYDNSAARVTLNVVRGFLGGR